MLNDILKREIIYERVQEWVRPEPTITIRSTLLERALKEPWLEYHLIVYQCLYPYYVHVKANLERKMDIHNLSDVYTATIILGSPNHN